MKNKILLISVALIVTAAFLFPACAGPAPAPTPEEMIELKIGSISPLTGAGAAWGNALRGGAEIACDDINAAGGLKVGGKTYAPRIIAYDSKYTAEGGVAAFTRLATADKVKYVIAPISSSVIMALHPLIEKFGILTMGDSYTGGGVSPDVPHFFRSMPTSAEYSMSMTKWLYDTQGIKSVVICSPNDESGYEVAAQNTRGYDATPIEVLSTEYYPRGMPDMAPLVTKVMALNPDAIEMDGSTPEDVGLLIKTAREMGYTGKIVKTGGPGIEAILAIAGDRAEGYIYYVPCDFEDPKIAPIVEKYRAKIPGGVNEIMPFFYDTVNWLFEAMRRAGTVDDVEAVREALITVDPFEGILGTYTWWGQEVYGINQQAMAPAYIGQVINGVPTVIAKAE